MARTMRLLRDGEVEVCHRCEIADRALARMRGLLGRSSLPAGEGLYIRPASSVHTAFMRFPIDVVFVDRDLLVLKVVPDLPPWRTAARRRAKATFELAAGEAARHGIVEGSQLSLVE